MRSARAAVPSSPPTTLRPGRAPTARQGRRRAWPPRLTRGRRGGGGAERESPRQRKDLEGGVVAIFLARWHSGEPLVVFGAGSAQRDYVFVSDVVDAVVASFAGTWHGVYNIGTGVATSVNDLIAALSEILGRPTGLSHTAARQAEIERSCV